MFELSGLRHLVFFYKKTRVQLRYTLAKIISNLLFVVCHLILFLYFAKAILSNAKSNRMMSYICSSFHKDFPYEKDRYIIQRLFEEFKRTFKILLISSFSKNT